MKKRKERIKLRVYKMTAIGSKNTSKSERQERLLYSQLIATFSVGL
jgi:hypothetical protein